MLCFHRRAPLGHSRPSQECTETPREEQPRPHLAWDHGSCATNLRAYCRCSQVTQIARAFMVAKRGQRCCEAHPVGNERCPTLCHHDCRRASLTPCNSVECAEISARVPRKHIALPVLLVPVSLGSLRRASRLKGRGSRTLRTRHLMTRVNLAAEKALALQGNR